MSGSIADVEQIRIKRHLRLRIGRLRRRINSRLRGTQREGQRLLSWRTYARRYPGGALAAAFGVGMATSAGLRGPKLLHAICALLVRRGAKTVFDGVRGELLKVWEESAPAGDAVDSGAENAEQKAEVGDGR